MTKFLKAAINGFILFDEALESTVSQVSYLDTNTSNQLLLYPAS